MDQKTKEELIKLALGKIKQIKSYKDSLGFDDWQKFADAYGLEYLPVGAKIPCVVVYIFYYRWMKYNKRTPLKHSKFFRLSGKNNSKSVKRNNKYLGISTLCYRVVNFPQYTVEDELYARKIINGQKRKMQKNRRSK